MNNSTDSTNVLSAIDQSNRIICTLFFGIMNIEILCLFILSIFWSIYLIIQIIKDNKKKKIELKTQKPEYMLENHMKNFSSNRTKKILLIAICMSECALVLSIYLYQIGKFDMIGNAHPYQSPQSSFIHLNEFHVYARYTNSLSHGVIRVSNVISTSSIYATFLFVRILTQFLIHQYSYYKSSLKLKRKLIFAISLLVTLSILGLIRPLILLQYALTVLVIIYEFIFIAILTKRLLRLLKQRLNDARLHENQSYRVVLYYRIAYADYKYSSTALLLALFFQVIAFSINFLHPIVMTLVVYPSMEFNGVFTIPRTSMYVIPQFAQEYDMIISSLEAIFLTTGYSLLIAPYLLVSLRRFFRYIKRRSGCSDVSVKNSKFQKLLKNNHDAYFLYH